jgi:hypothetical protein
MKNFKKLIVLEKGDNVAKIKSYTKLESYTVKDIVEALNESITKKKNNY